MRKGFLICVVLFIFSNRAWSQQDDKKNNSSATNSVDTSNINHTKSTEILLNVLFATNEDCDLYIDNEPKGLLLKSQFRYLQLILGSHTYRVKSKTTFDELKENFTVVDGKANEIFIDLLYVVDEKNAERENVKNNKQAVAEPLVFDNKKTGNDQPQAAKFNLSKDGEKEIVNSLSGNMVRIKSGSFMMGNSRSPFKDEVEHPVAISTLFFCKYEVTQHQWQTIMGYNPSLNLNCATCPVDNVSWEEVIRFIRKLNNISNKRFRLPTEAEWEYVARIGGKAEIDTAGGQEAYIKKTAWFYANANKQTHPVGLRQANVAGVFDMMGNVSEWCADWYSAYYSKEDFNQLNPEGPPLGKEKIIRGGNYKDYLGDRFRPSLRNRKIPTEKGSEVGFRLVMELVE